VNCCTPAQEPRGRSITALAIELIEDLRAGDSLAAGQILADAQAAGGRQAVGAVLASACQWGMRTASSAPHHDGSPWA
jgi:hypothetical protein